MAYTAAQLVSEYTAATDGVAPDAAEQSLLQTYAGEDAVGTLTDAQTLRLAIQAPLVQATTDVAEATYAFFTGGTPSATGLNYLINSGGTNPDDLNSAYYTAFNTENRYYNFAINLATGAGAGAAAFAANFGSLTLNETIAVAYELIIGSANVGAAAAAAGIASIESSTGYFQQVAAERAASSNQDLATKAIAIGYIMEEGVKADAGTYANALDHFTAALANGTATYATDLALTYANTINIYPGPGPATVNAGNSATSNQAIAVAVGDGVNTVNIHGSHNDSASVVAGAGPNQFNISEGASATVDITAGGGNNGVNVAVDSTSVVSITAGDGANNVVVTTGNGIDEHITVTVGNGANQISAVAAASSFFTIAAGNGNNAISLHDLTGLHSGFVVTAGNGANTITAQGELYFGGVPDIFDITVGDGGNAINVLNSGGNTVDVQAGSGNDLILIDSLGATITANGGGGTNTLETTSAAAGDVISTHISNFQILELADTLSHDINLAAFGATNNFDQIILNGLGSFGTNAPTISAISPGSVIALDDEVGSFAPRLTLVVNGAATNPNLALGLTLNENVAHAGDLMWGTIYLNQLGESLGTVNLAAGGLSATSATSWLSLLDNGIHTLHLTGTFSLNLSGSMLTGLQTIDAGTFTGALSDFDVFDHTVTSVNLGLSGTNAGVLATTPADNLEFGNENLAVTLGQGANDLIVGSGDDTLTLGDGDNHVTLLGGNDIVTLGNGDNRVDAGVGRLQISVGSGSNFFLMFSNNSSTFALAPHASHTVTFDFLYAGGLLTPDTINGFNPATDVIEFSGINNPVPFNFANDYYEANGMAAVNAAVANAQTLHPGDPSAVLDISTGNLYIDADSSGNLTSADIQIRLVGVSHLTASALVG